MMFIRIMAVPGNMPIGGKANGKMVRANAVWEPILKAMNEQTAYVKSLCILAIYRYLLLPV